MNKSILLNAALIVLLAFVTLFAPSVDATVTLGGVGGSVTLTNPDSSYFYFDSSNSTTYAYVSNMPDGWWNIFLQTVNEQSDYWMLGFIFGIIGVSFAVSFLFMKRRKRKN